MAKIALLIGVSEYGKGLTGLPGTQADIQKMQRVLQNPQIGGFDEVTALHNPDRTEMESAIETLFTENRSRDDLILLYFAGHGIQDDNGTLYLATSITETNAVGRIRTAMAVPASAVHSYMSRSESQRQVLILDCCFSGAFATGMTARKAEVATVNVKEQLGGQGRAVLTSSTATQFAYEKDGEGIYTGYLVEGLETGAADRDGNGQITVDELHEYAKEKVREAAPSMQPEIYLVQEGYKILIAYAPQGDPRLVYRKEFDERARQKRGRLSAIEQRALKFRYQELGLSPEEAEQIANEVLQPYQVFWDKLNEFEQAVKETLEYDPQLNTDSLNDLQYLQRVLKLRDEDVFSILNAHNITLNLPSSIDSSTAEKQNLEGKPESLKSNIIDQTEYEQEEEQITLEDDLSSEKGIDYTKLRDLLKAQNWKVADAETHRVIIQAIGKKPELWFELEDLINFPRIDLKTIDSLWIKYSNGHFGFSIQKQVYVECGGKLDGGYPGDAIWRKFCARVGWLKRGRWQYYSALDFSLASPKGGLPTGMINFRPNITEASVWFKYGGGLLSHLDL